LSRAFFVLSFIDDGLFLTSLVDLCAFIPYLPSPLQAREETSPPRRSFTPRVEPPFSQRTSSSRFDFFPSPAILYSLVALIEPCGPFFFFLGPRCFPVVRDCVFSCFLGCGRMCCPCSFTVISLFRVLWAGSPLAQRHFQGRVVMFSSLAGFLFLGELCYLLISGSPSTFLWPAMIYPVEFHVGPTPRMQLPLVRVNFLSPGRYIFHNYRVPLVVSFFTRDLGFGRHSCPYFFFAGPVP